MRSDSWLVRRQHLESEITLYRNVSESRVAFHTYKYADELIGGEDNRHNTLIVATGFKLEYTPWTVWD